MSAANPQHLVRDFGPVGTAIMGLLGVVLGGLLGWYVYLDGLAAFRNTYENPLRIFLDQSHYLNTMSLWGLIVGLILLLVIVHRIWSIDRMILFLTATLMVTEVVPGISSLLGLLLLGKLFGGVLRKGDVHWPLSPIGMVVLLILAAYSTSFLNAENPVGVLGNFLPRIPYIGLALFLPLCINTTDRLLMLVDFLIICAMVSLGVEFIQGILSAATGQEITFAAAQVEMFDAPWGPTARLTGLMAHPNRYSNVTSTVAVIALWLALQPKEMVSQRRRFMLFTVFVIFCFGVLFSWSRSGWLSLGVTVLLLPFFRWPHLSPVFLMVQGYAVFLGLSTGAIQFAYEYVRDLSRGSADFRWHITHIGLQAFFEHPVIGIGVEGTKDYFNAYELQVHNASIQMLADLGLVGLGAFTILVVTLISCLARVITSKTADPRLRSLAMGMGVASLVSLIQSFVEVFLWYQFLWTFIAILGCVYIAYREERQRQILQGYAPELQPQHLLSS